MEARPNPKPLLPRLYEPIDNWGGVQQDDGQRDTKHDKDALEVKYWEAALIMVLTSVS
jgi:hypothetical protein